jgi:hypothetical protein
MEAADFINKTL